MFQVNSQEDKYNVDYAEKCESETGTNCAYDAILQKLCFVYGRAGKNEYFLFCGLRIDVSDYYLKKKSCKYEKQEGGINLKFIALK